MLESKIDLSLVEQKTIGEEQFGIPILEILDTCSVEKIGTKREEKKQKKTNTCREIETELRRARKK